MGFDPSVVPVASSGSAWCAGLRSLRGGFPVEVELVVSVELRVQDRGQVRQYEVRTHDASLPVVIAVLWIGAQGGVPHIAIVHGLK